MLLSPFVLATATPHSAGDIKALEHCTQLTVVYMSYTDVQGKFEDFKVLGALLELDIGDCANIDCKNALEVLPTMPWAAQIQKLGLHGTDAEGTMGTFFF